MALFSVALFHVGYLGRQLFEPVGAESGQVDAKLDLIWAKMVVNLGYSRSFEVSSVAGQIARKSNKT